MDSDDGDSDDYLESLEVYNMDNKDRVIWVTPRGTGKGDQDGTRYRVGCVCTPIQAV